MITVIIIKSILSRRGVVFHCRSILQEVDRKKATMIDMVLIAMDDTQQMSTATHKEQKQSIGLIHQKMQDRYKVVERLPDKADDFDSVFKYADAYGKIRLGYFGGKFEEEIGDAQNSFASAVGGILGIKTAELAGFSLNAATYISQDLPFFYNTDKRSNEFYTNEGKSYAYLAEASINFRSRFFETMAGRFAVDMPYANRDDIRMSQNSFEGAWAHIHYTKEWSTQIFFIQRWAGFDSSDENSSQSEFKKLIEGGSGMVGASLAYRYNDESEVSVWYHSIDKMADIFYGEINGVYDFSEAWHLDYGVQIAYIRQKSDSNVEGDVYGAMFIGHYKDFFLGAALNFARVDKGQYITDGFGGGPYFTSLDEATIAFVSEIAPGVDIDTYRFSVGYDKEEWHSSCEYTYGYMGANSTDIKENDLIYTYDLHEKWQAQAVAANFKSNFSGNSFNRIVVRIDYNF